MVATLAERPPSRVAARLTRGLGMAVVLLTTAIPKPQRVAARKPGLIHRQIEVRWRPGARLSALGDDAVVHVLDSCQQASAFAASLPTPASGAEAWAPWREYVRTLYGAHAVGRVNVSRFSVFHSLVVRRSNETLRDGVDGRPALVCAHGRLFFSNAPHISSNPIRFSALMHPIRPGGRWTKKLPMWERVALLPPSGERVEVLHEWPRVFPEGMGYGCWAYAVRGSGVHLGLGRTAAMSRAAAIERFCRAAADVDATTGMPVNVTRTRSLHPGHLKHFCAWVPPASQLGTVPALSLGECETTRSSEAFLNASASCRARPGAAEKLARLRGAADGRVFCVPAKDGLIAIGARAAGLDSVQLSSVVGRAVVEIVLTHDACIFAQAPLKACLPTAALGVLGGYSGAHTPCTCEAEQSERARAAARAPPRHAREATASRSVMPHLRAPADDVRNSSTEQPTAVTLTGAGAALKQAALRLSGLRPRDAAARRALVLREAMHCAVDQSSDADTTAAHSSSS